MWDRENNRNGSAGNPKEGRLSGRVLVAGDEIWAPSLSPTSALQLHLLLPCIFFLLPPFCCLSTCPWVTLSCTSLQCALSILRARPKTRRRKQGWATAGSSAPKTSRNKFSTKDGGEWRSVIGRWKQQSVRLELRKRSSLSEKRLWKRSSLRGG